MTGKCKYFEEHLLPNYDYTFCINEKCEVRNKCGRNINKYEPSNRLISMSYFNDIDNEEE